MWAKIKKALKFWSTVYGSTSEDNSTPYLTRVMLTPRTPWGQLRMNIFWRGDKDPDPHDHPWGFWTFPLHSYMEWVLDAATMTLRMNAVQRWKWHHRPAGYAHILIGPLDIERIGRPVVTFMWTEPWQQDWGFFVNENYSTAPSWEDYHAHRQSYIARGLTPPNYRKIADFDERKDQFMRWRYYVDGLTLKQARQNQLMDHHAGTMIRLCRFRADHGFACTCEADRYKEEELYDGI